MHRGINFCTYPFDGVLWDSPAGNFAGLLYECLPFMYEKLREMGIIKDSGENLLNIVFMVNCLALIKKIFQPEDVNSFLRVILGNA